MITELLRKGQVWKRVWILEVWAELLKAGLR